jgi:hypothetical protein
LIIWHAWDFCFSLNYVYAFQWKKPLTQTLKSFLWKTNIAWNDILFLLIHSRNNVVIVLYYSFLIHVIYNTALTLLSSRLSNGPGGSSRQRNSLTARLFKG